MKYSKVINMSMFSLIFIVFGCFENTEQNVKNIKVISVDSTILRAEEPRNDTGNRLQFKAQNKDSINVTYYLDTIHVTFNNKRPIKIQYSTPVDIVVPCNCLAIKKDKGQFNYENYYLYKDSLLLLPVMDLNNRINLFVLNINNGILLYTNKPRKSYMLSTYLTWFIFNEKNGTIITSNSLDLEGKTMIHFFKINHSEIRYINTINKIASLDIYDDDEKMKTFIRKITLQ